MTVPTLAVVVVLVPKPAMFCSMMALISSAQVAVAFLLVYLVVVYKILLVFDLVVFQWWRNTGWTVYRGQNIDPSPGPIMQINILIWIRF